MISKTIGIGQDYTNLGAFFAAYPTISDDATLTIVGTVTETASTTFNYQTGKTLRITGSSGSVIELANYTVSYSVLASGVDIGTFILDNCYLKNGRISIRGNNNTTYFNAYVYNNFFRDADLYFIDTVGGCSMGTYAVYNNKFFITGATKAALTIETSPDWPPGVYMAYVENNSIYGGDHCIELITSGTAWTIRNNVLCNAVNADITADVSSVVTYANNADSDNSLPAHTGKLTGITSADFVSVDPDSSDFLRLANDGHKKLAASAEPVRGQAPLICQFTPDVEFDYGSMGALAYSGAAPTYATTDIEGNERPGEDGLYSIGCHEAQFQGWIE